MIFYFTGTGNSLWVAKALSEALGEQLVSIADAMQGVSSTVSEAADGVTDIAQKTLEVSGIVQGNETLVDNNRENIVRLNSVIEMFHDEK